MSRFRIFDIEIVIGERRQIHALRYEIKGPWHTFVTEGSEISYLAPISVKEIISEASNA